MEIACNAESPFDPTSHTPDVILRSSNNVDFYVMKSFLAFSSPDVFAPMFTLPQAEHDIPSPSGLHIVPVAEDSKVLRILLLNCYPLDFQDEVNDVGDIVRAMSAARKYAMDFAAKRIEKMFLSEAHSQLDNSPLHIYALACRYGFEELARAAVKRTLEIPASHLSSSPELKHITGMDMYQLIECRYRCVRAIWDWYFTAEADCFLEVGPCGEVYDEYYVWFVSKSQHTPAQPCSFVVTRAPGAGSDIFAAQWWSTYFVALMKEIELCPSRRTVFKFSDEVYYKALTDASSCGLCRGKAVRHLDLFREDLAKNIDEIVTQELSELKFETP